MRHVWVDSNPIGEQWVPKSEFRRPAGPAVLPDYAAYDCPITGDMVEGRAAHRENLKAHGCRVMERGEQDDFVKNREREADRQIERIVDDMTERWRSTDYDGMSDREVLQRIGVQE